MKATVVVERFEGDGKQLLRQMSEASEAIGLHDRAVNAKRILIKPNLTYPFYREGVTTRVEFVDALVHSLKKSNSGIEVLIAEGEGGYNSFSMTDAMANMGYGNIANRYPGVTLVNLSEVPRKSVALDTKRGSYELELPEVFSDVDFSISCPLPKVHSMTILTLSLKNLWGCLPDTLRLRNHYMLPHILALLVRHLRFDYAFLDGMYGLDNNGPMAGDAVRLDWFVAANSLGALDQVVAGMMGYDWKAIRHLKIANSYGVVPGEQRVDVIGDIAPLERKFRLRRSAWNYPAYAAFHSRFLTQLFYLSGLSGPLHDIMYMFRKRDISEDFNRREQ